MLLSAHATYLEGERVAFEDIPVIKVHAPLIQHLRMGYLKDADGREWNIGAIFGPVVYAMPLGVWHESIYGSTSPGNFCGRTTWTVHRFVVVSKNERKVE